MSAKSIRKVGALIVAYNPDSTMEDRTRSVLNQVDILVVVDNSERSDSLHCYDEFLSNSKSVFVIKNNENVGIAKALNQGCSYLQKEGCSCALMLDQDSEITKGLVNTLYNYLSGVQDCGVVGPLIIPNNVDYDAIKCKLRFVVKKSKLSFTRIYPEKKPFEVAFNITSGSLCDLKIWKELGGFWEELFIDGVDNEYGLRLLDRGYKTIIHPEAILYQKYGRQKVVQFFGRKYFPTFHGGQRRYYASRNRVLIWKRYCFTQPFYILWDLMSFLNTIKLILLFEDKKLVKFYYVLLGVRDGLLNKTGKLY